MNETTEIYHMIQKRKEKKNNKNNLRGINPVQQLKLISRQFHQELML